jgi:hypothetical protein
MFCVYLLYIFSMPPYLLLNYTPCWTIDFVAEALNKLTDNKILCFWTRQYTLFKQISGEFVSSGGLISFVTQGVDRHLM